MAAHAELLLLMSLIPQGPVLVLDKTEHFPAKAIIQPFPGFGECGQVAVDLLLVLVAVKRFKLRLVIEADLAHVPDFLHPGRRVDLAILYGPDIADRVQEFPALGIQHLVDLDTRGLPTYLLGRSLMT
ncbi:hypothetical protein [Thiohalorhabdus sp.]|uniref:hypothetical protein n=1 Tax=Thiohalorhabdus sp. TaxID=3094134 RepID=UPI002FC3C8A8